MGSPYKDKLTYFSSGEDFENSDNSGFTDLGNGRFKVRIDGECSLLDQIRPTLKCRLR